MNDAFINALNAQKSTNTWINALTQNMANMYTPGYRESAINFKTFLRSSLTAAIRPTVKCAIPTL